jgi:hypothetical protein
MQFLTDTDIAELSIFLTSNASNANNAFLYRKQMKMMLLQGVGKQSMARVGSSLRLFFTQA